MIGSTLGPYRIVAELGSGGMGRVYAALVDGRVAGLSAGTRVALKIVHPHLLETPGFFKRFLREAEIGKAVVHENVVRTYDCDSLTVDGRRVDFLVMEHVEGQTLRALLVELGRVPEELCRHIGREVAKGLAAIHAAGAVHRDVKPENVLITRDHVVKLMDLGVARLADEALRLSQSGVFVGSVEYAAPEQFGFRSAEGAEEAIPRGRERSARSAKGDDVDGRGSALDGRADLHALGAVLYELATGQQPFHGDDFRAVMRRVLDERPRRPAEINPQLSPFLEETVLRLLAKDRAERFASAAELAQVLEDGESSAWWQARAKSILVETRRPLRRIRIPRETALYGRDEELSRLRSLFERARAGEGQVVLVEGEAGIGKSRLMDEFVARLQRDGADVNFLFGSYPPGGAATASGAFSTAWREHFGDEALDDALRAALPQTPLLVPAFAALLRGDAPPKDAERLTKGSLQTVFVGTAESLAAERPTILVIDDLHFASEEGRALFAALAHAVPGHRLLLVGTSRPPIDEEWAAHLTRLPQTSRLAVPRLGPRDLAALLRDSLKSAHVAEELGLRIAEKTDGNPYFVFEILRDLREGRFLTQKPDGTWATTQVIRELRIPSSVKDLIDARIADLAPEDRELLHVAASCGFEFDPLLVGDVLRLERFPLLRRLGTIESAHRLVRAAGRRYRFDHHQVQEVLYAGMSELHRETYHAAIADVLEAREGAAAGPPKDLEGRLCADLAEHFLRGGQGRRALRYVDAGLTCLETNWHNDAAVRLIDRVLAVPGLSAGAERCGLLLRKAAKLALVGRGDDERAALAEAATLADADGDATLRVRTKCSMGWYLTRACEHAAAEAVLLSAVDLARATGNRLEEMRPTRLLGIAMTDVGRLDEARTWCETAAAVAREVGDRRNEATAIESLANVLYELGRFDESRALHEHVLTNMLDVLDRHGRAAVEGNLGNTVLALGRCEEALAAHERNVQLARETGHGAGVALALHNVGNVLRTLGRIPEAEARFVPALALARETGHRPLEAGVLVGLGETFAERGATADAEQSLRAARDAHESIGRAGNAPNAMRSLGAFLVRTDRCDEGCALLEEALVRLAGSTAHFLPAALLADLASFGRRDPGDAVLALGRVESRLTVCEHMEIRLALWRATRDAAHAARAGSLLDFMVEHAPPDCREPMVANVRLHREIVAAAKDAGL